MSEASSTLSDLDRHSLFEACAREARRIGGDERTAQYFFVRAESSRIWLSDQGAVTVADMDIQDWCNAIAWSAPGIGRSPKRSRPHEDVDGDDPHSTGHDQEEPSAAFATAQTAATRATADRPADATRYHGKQPRSGAKFRRSSQRLTSD